MKMCEYCEGVVEDSATSCPNCSSHKFMNLCPKCGKGYEGPVCPDCEARVQSERRAAEEARQKSEAEEKANRGLVWKTALTFFMPFIGGFFLIKDNVREGFRIFAIVWCSLMAISCASTGGDIGSTLIVSVLMLLPFAVYVIKKEFWKWNELDSRSKLISVAFICVVLVTLVTVVINGNAPETQQAPTSSTVASASLSSSSAESAPASSTAAKSVA